MAVKLDEGTIQNVIDLYNKGLTYEEISKECYICLVSVHRIIHRTRISTPAVLTRCPGYRKNTITSEVKQKVRDLRRQKLTYVQISSRCGISVTSVKKIVN